MSDANLAAALAAQQFAAELDEKQRVNLADGARLVSFPTGAFLAKEGDPAIEFYLVQAGHVAIEIHIAQRGGVVVQTMGPGEVVGWSWLVPPHRWQFDARAVEPVEAIALDGAALRRKCASDHALGYQVLHKLVTIISSRLAATRLQLLDVFK